jgi:hypothetical protein
MQSDVDFSGSGQNLEKTDLSPIFNCDVVASPSALVTSAMQSDVSPIFLRLDGVVDLTCSCDLTAEAGAEESKSCRFALTWGAEASPTAFLLRADAEYDGVDVDPLLRREWVCAL